MTVWCNNFFGAQTIGIMPYAAHLNRFPAYLQHWQMEVKLAKVLAIRIIAELVLGPEPTLAHDASTNALISRYRKRRGSSGDCDIPQ